MHIADGQTKDKIIMLLKKTGGLTAEELSKRVGITPMGVRQHLIALERKNIISYEARKHGIGRPVFVYKLTASADDIFQKGYSGFTLDLLSDLEALDGRPKIDALFKRRKDRLVKERARLLAPYDFHGKIMALSNLLEEDGYLVELKDDERHYDLSLFNCPLSRVSNLYPEACNYELEHVSELLGKPAVMAKAISFGDPFCLVQIPKDNL
ncbi:MAG: winged helix-turn-helix transcriptional regulator [Nitrospiraceae bacterium]|nr:winged helix-turn-helix transcriptional regulator [Nitrospiraceae bacterium]